MYGHGHFLSVDAVFMGVIFGLFSPEPETFRVERPCNEFTRRDSAFMCSFVLSNICLWCLCASSSFADTITIEDYETEIQYAYCDSLVVMGRVGSRINGSIKRGFMFKNQLTFLGTIHVFYWVAPTIVTGRKNKIPLNWNNGLKRIRHTTKYNVNNSEIICWYGHTV